MSCYYPNGNPSSGDIPCDSDNDATACCPPNWKCESNGLCSLAAQGYYGRYTCTDKTWESDNCPRFCTGSNSLAGAEAVLQCSSGKYCCDANRPDALDQNPPRPGCCDTSTSRFSLDSLPIIAGSNQAAASSSTSISSSRTTSSSTTTSLSSTTASPTTTSSSTTSSNTPTTTSSTSSATSFAAISSTTSPTARSSSSQSAPSATTSSTSSQAAGSTSSRSTSILVVTSVITSNGGQSTLITSTSLPVAAPASVTPAPHRKPLGPIIGPAVAVPVAVIGIAALLLFFFFRSRRSRSKHASSSVGPQQEPKPMYGNPEPPFPTNPELDGSPVIANFNKDAGVYHDHNTMANSPSTAPPSYRGSSGVYGTQYANRDSRRTELEGSPTVAGSPTSPKLHGNAAVEMDEGARQPSELLGNTYRPYRPPGFGVQR